MTGFDLLLVRFVLASGGCIAAGLSIWGMTKVVQRYLPSLSTQRSIWLLAQITVFATFLAIWLPHSERLRLIPPIDITPAVKTQQVAPAGPAALATSADSGLGTLADTTEHSWLAFGARAWTVMYLLGLGYAIHKLWRAQRSLNALATSGYPMAARYEQEGFGSALMQTAAPTVIEVDAPVSPMLLGPFKPRLLLPSHLRSLEPMQRQLIIEHELMHLRRRDLHWTTAGVVLQTLLWFNPFMRLLRASLSHAQELGCDRDVLKGRPQAQRKAYAAALIAQLKWQHRPVDAALAFGGVGVATVAARIAQIREPGLAARNRWARWVAAGGLASIFIASLALQPALSKNMARQNLAASTAIDCISMDDAATGKPLIRQGQCEERVTPASTFKIAISLMGYDSGILNDEHAPVMPFKEGYVAWSPTWRQATDPTSWMNNSVVWYAQLITSKLGAPRFKRYVTSFNYGNQDVTGDAGADNGLAVSWISSSLKISPVEQLAFLRRVVNRELPLNANAYDMTARILKIETLPSGWEVHGKTGTAYPVLPDGTDDRTRAYGWFVGWATKGQRTVVFARLIQDQKEEADPAGPRVRAAFLRDLPAQLEAL